MTVGYMFSIYAPHFTPVSRILLPICWEEKAGRFREYRRRTSFMSQRTDVSCSVSFREEMTMHDGRRVTSLLRAFS